jgi:NADH dehydrogenase
VIGYQQAKAIAHNLVAISMGEVPEEGHVFLRGTLMKLGSIEGAANIFGKLQVNGRLGHAIRHLVYLEMLPTPVHNLRITAEWLSDELLSHAQSLV